MTLENEKKLAAWICLLIAVTLILSLSRYWRGGREMAGQAAPSEALRSAVSR